MKKTEFLQRRKLAEFAAQLFTTAGRAVSDAGDVPSKFFALAQALQNLQPQLQAIDSDTNAALTDMLAKAARDIANGLSTLDGEGCKETGVAQVLDLTGALTLFSDALRNQPPTGEQAADTRILDMQQQAGNLAFEFHTAAGNLLYSVGLDRPERPPFRFPTPGNCACFPAEQRGDMPACGPDGYLPDQLAVLTVQQTDLHYALCGIVRLVDDVAMFMGKLGALFTAVPIAFINPAPTPAPWPPAARSPSP